MDGLKSSFTIRSKGILTGRGNDGAMLRYDDIADFFFFLSRYTISGQDPNGRAISELVITRL